MGGAESESDKHIKNKHTLYASYNHLADKQSNKNECSKSYAMPILIKQNIKKV